MSQSPLSSNRALEVFMSLPAFRGLIPVDNALQLKKNLQTRKTSVRLRDVVKRENGNHTASAETITEAVARTHGNLERRLCRLVPATH